MSDDEVETSRTFWVPGFIFHHCIVLTCSLLVFSSGWRRRWILSHSLRCGSIAGGWTLRCGRYLVLLCSISPLSRLSSRAQVRVFSSTFFNNVVNTDCRTVEAAEEVCFQNPAVSIWWVLLICYISSSYGLIWKIPEESMLNHGSSCRCKLQTEFAHSIHSPDGNFLRICLVPSPGYLNLQSYKLSLCI